MHKKSGRRSLGAASIQSILECSGVVASTSVVGKARKFVEMSGQDIMRSFASIEPLLLSTKEANPGLMYEVRQDADNTLQSVVVMMPYTQEFFPYCMQVIGIDGCHTKPIQVSKQPKTFLQKMILTAITGRTANNENILYGFCLGYSEKAEDIGLLIELMRRNNVDLNQRRITVLSDRGTAILKAIRDYLPNALQMCCMKHISDNLRSKKMGKYVALASKARNCVTESKYKEVMTQLHISSSECYNYLTSIEENWQLYKAIERGNALYGMKTDNLVEQFFASIIEARYFTLHRDGKPA